MIRALLLYMDGWLRDRPPVAVIGGTIHVYDLDPIPPAERWRQ